MRTSCKRYLPRMTILTASLLLTTLSFVKYVLDQHSIPSKDLGVSYWVRTANNPQYNLNVSFAAALRARADANKTVILSSIDRGYLEMGLNLYETSLRKLAIRNFLFVCSDEASLQALVAYGIPSILGRGDDDSEEASSHGTTAFQRKTLLKLYFTLDALKLGYNVLVVDADVVFLKNPFPHLSCGHCDIQYQTDGKEINSGFLYARPTKSTVKLYEEAIVIATNSSLIYQAAITLVAESMIASKTLKGRELSAKHFLRGDIYFEEGQRMFHGDNPCDECVIVHNNWLVGGAAKEYRFKEHLMWDVDLHGYYSDTTRTYLTYSNSAAGSIEEEMTALKNALWLGHVLNRTLILPTFSCDNCDSEACNNKAGHCSLNTHLRIKSFEKYFRGTYREHVFLKHHKVPSSVKISKTALYIIQSNVTNSMDGGIGIKKNKRHQILRPKTVLDGPSREELLSWFGNERRSVLRIHSLYGKFVDLHRDEGFAGQLANALVDCDYRQHCELWLQDR